MIGRDPIVLLQHEAKRRPIVADLLDRVASLTDEDIEAADVPMMWYRSALKQLRDKKKLEALIAAIPLDDDSGTGENDKLGLTLEYTGSNFWLKPTKNAMQLEISTGDWLFYPKEGGGAWLNHLFIPYPPQQLAQSKHVAEQTRADYVISYNEHINTRHNISPASDDQPRKGFVIFRTPGSYQ